jgi:acyl carrier protein
LARISKGAKKMDETLKGVKEVIVDVLKIDDKDITLDTKFIEDLKADSMDQFFLIDGLCEKFNITISDEDARNIKSVKDAVDYIGKIKKAA